MKDLSKKIENISKSEISKINHKINGINFLEILKFQIVDSLDSNQISFEKKNIEDFNEKYEYDDENKKLEILITSSKNSSVKLNTKIEKDTLIFCLNESLSINLLDYKTKKNINIKCIPKTGIVLPNQTNCNLKFAKNVIFVEINLIDKLKNIENLKNDTI